MYCSIYKSRKKTESYLYVASQKDFSRVPKTLLDLLGDLEFVMDLELSTSRKLAQADAATVIKQLNEQGFYLQLPPKHYVKM